MKKKILGLALILALNGCSNEENLVENKIIEPISNMEISTSGYGARGFGVADIDKDGDLDMVHSKGSGRLYLSLNDGKGNYITSNKAIPNVEIPTSGYGGRAIGLGDVNNDGEIDILYATDSGKIKVFLNKGNFSF